MDGGRGTGVVDGRAVFDLDGTVAVMDLEVLLGGGDDTVVGEAFGEGVTEVDPVDQEVVPGGHAAQSGGLGDA